MVKTAGGRGRSGGATRRKPRPKYVENPGLKPESDFTNSAKRILAFRRFWLFLLTALLVTVGLMSAFGFGLF